MNELPGATSHYWWKGRLETSSETLLILKTRPDRVSDVIAAINELHPYDTPELVSLPVVQSAPAYAAWVSAACARPDDS